MVIKRFLGLFFLTISFYSYSPDTYTQKYSGTCQWYADPFGPLKTGYTMGDLIRYSVENNSNKPDNYLYGLLKPLSAASVVQNYAYNKGNLYNALGYLYAGWIALNDKTNKTFVWGNGSVDQSLQTNLSKNPSLWINEYRKQTPKNAENLSLKEFDNNRNGVNCCAPSLTQALPPLKVGWYSPHSGDELNTGGGFSSDGQGLVNAVASLGWCSNTRVGDFTVYYGSNLLFPLIQFFGARIAHILGVVVNDVPWSDDDSSSGAVGAKGATASGSPAFSSPLISGDGNGTALPMFAVMSGGPYTAGANVPKDMIQPSTAHYGSINTFLSKLTSGTGDDYNYLKYHLQPTVSRLSQLCLYEISKNSESLNLVKINDTNVTSMDQGVIACIQNNTGVGLLVKQISAGGAAQEIGQLDNHFNNFYLNTASLVSNSSASTSSDSTSSLSTATNIIKIEDAYDKATLKNTNYSDLNLAIYIQVLQAADVNNLILAFNALQSGGYSYNQTQEAPTSLSGNYLILTNFDPTINSGKLTNVSTDSNVLDSYRMQIIDTDGLLGKPYYISLQINKENLGYGLLTPANTENQISKSELNTGVKNAPFLYPSFTSVKTFTWQNICHALEGGKGFSKIPYMILPDSVWQYSSGALIYYVIWKLAYAAALTECSYNGVDFFATDTSLETNIFGLFNTDSQAVDLKNIKSGYSSQIYKPIVDAQVNLALGSSLDLSDFSILSSATLDSGGNLHQDIPVLNLAKKGFDIRGNNIVSINHEKSDYLNLSATIGKLKKTIPSKFRDLYQNILLFSLPTQALKDGVNINITKTQSVAIQGTSTTAASDSIEYDLIITSTKDFTDSNEVLYKAGSVLIAQKVTLDTDLYDFGNIAFDFLHTKNDTTWTSQQQISESVSNFSLKYSSVAKKNTLFIGGKISLGKKSSLIDNFIPYSIDMKKKSISSFNIDMTNHAFAFVQNPWNPGQICSADIASVFGLTDFKIALVGVDSKNRLVLNSADKSKIDHLVVYLFDQNNGQIGQPLDVVYDANGLKLSAAQKSFDDIDQSFTLGLNSKLYPMTFNYPFAIEFKDVKPFGFATPYTVNLQNKSFDSFYFRTNNFAFTFNKNSWNTKASPLPISADISSAIAGKKDFKMVIMGADKNNLPILMLSKNNNVDHLNVYIYDKDNKLIQAPIAIPLDNKHVCNFNTKSVNGITASSVLADIQSMFTICVNKLPEAAVTYPFVIDFTNVKPSVVALTKSPKEKFQPKAKVTPIVPAVQNSDVTINAKSNSVVTQAADEVS